MASIALRREHRKPDGKIGSPLICTYGSGEIGGGDFKNRQ
jgi:hypothetical protein